MNKRHCMENDSAFCCGEKSQISYLVRMSQINPNAGISTACASR